MYVVDILLPMGGWVLGGVVPLSQPLIIWTRTEFVFRFVGGKLSPFAPFRDWGLVVVVFFFGVLALVS